MQPIPSTISQDDLHQWLSNCYFYHFTDGQMKLSYLCHVHGPNGSPVHGIHHILDGSKIPLPDPGELWCHWPHGGAINWPHTRYAVYAERKPRKQWRRSFYLSCYGLSRPGFVSTPDFQAHKTTTESIVALAEPKYYSYTQIVNELFPGGWASAAINPQITVINGERKKIYFNQTLVGKITPDNYLYLTDESVRRQIVRNLDGIVE